MDTLQRFSRAGLRGGMEAAFALAAAAMLLLAAPSWEKKDFAQWSKNDAMQLLNSSPWARQATVSKAKLDADRKAALTTAHPMAQTGLASYGGESGGPDAYGGGGGFGSQTSGSTGRIIIVQWSSALPVRLAQLKAEAANGQPSPVDVQGATRPVNAYAVTVAGLPAPKDKAAAEKQLANAAVLLRKGKAPIRSTGAEVIVGTGNSLVMFSFPKSNAISLDDKEVEFKTEIGPMEVSRKFELKDMRYRGNIEL